jgi:hypothetical protein
MRDINQHEARLNLGTDDRFRGADWRREKDFLDFRFQRIETWIERHDTRFPTVSRETK